MSLSSRCCDSTAASPENTGNTAERARTNAAKQPAARRQNGLARFIGSLETKEGFSGGDFREVLSDSTWKSGKSPTGGPAPPRHEFSPLPSASRHRVI